MDSNDPAYLSRENQQHGDQSINDEQGDSKPILLNIKEETFSSQISHNQRLPTLRGQANRLYQILLNLLSNAVKFSTQGQIMIYAKYDFKKSELICTVKDQGSGFIEGEEEQFLNYKSHIKYPNPSNSGYSLPIVVTLLNKLKGKIWCKSFGINKGSMFTFSLPMQVMTTENSSS